MHNLLTFLRINLSTNEISKLILQYAVILQFYIRHGNKMIRSLSNFIWLITRFVSVYKEVY